MVEGSWSDRLEDELVSEENRRYSNLGWLLRARFLIDVDCWGEVKGQPIKPGAIMAAAGRRLGRSVVLPPRDVLSRAVQTAVQVV